MTDNNRNAFRPEGQAQQSNDPLLELTRLFNLDFNPNGNNDSNRPNNSESGADVTPAPETNGPDDAPIYHFWTLVRRQKPRRRKTLPILRTISVRRSKM